MLGADGVLSLFVTGTVHLLCVLEVHVEAVALCVALLDMSKRVFN